MGITKFAASDGGEGSFCPGVCRGAHAACAFTAAYVRQFAKSARSIRGDVGVVRASQGWLEGFFQIITYRKPIVPVLLENGTLAAPPVWVGGIGVRA